MRIGAHVSIKGGLPNAPDTARDAGCECFQIFTRSPRGGAAKPITTSNAKAFRAACDAAGQGAWYVHTPYYINLASADGVIRNMSVGIVREELKRATTLAASAVMTHLGAAKDDDGGKALERVVRSVRTILSRYRGSARLLVELAAGSESIVGTSFEELAVVVGATSGECGVCLDTQHMFASGYDIRDRRAARKTFDEFDTVIGLEHLGLIHANDSKVPFASRKDRHEHIGKGEIGEKGFEALLTLSRLQSVDVVLETRSQGVREDVRTLKKLRARKA
jgi:deoxyribonuclease-4